MAARRVFSLSGCVIGRTLWLPPSPGSAEDVPLRKARWHIMAEQADAGLADTTLFADLRRTVAAANGGEVAARFEICRLLDRESDIWRSMSDLAGLAEERLIKLATGGIQTR